VKFSGGASLRVPLRGASGSPKNQYLADERDIQQGEHFSNIQIRKIVRVDEHGFAAADCD
jgi:hypothetical protein